MHEMTLQKRATDSGVGEEGRKPAANVVLPAGLLNSIAGRARDGLVVAKNVTEPLAEDDTSAVLRKARSRIDELATANSRKDEFLAMVGHELRSPLASIQNSIR